jgi:hypothetical protein
MAFSEAWSPERKLVDLLERRYGSGLGKGHHDGNKGLFHEAIRMGFISNEGRITNKGRVYLEDRGHRIN